MNLYDGTVEGIRLLDVPAGCVQYHPEAGPGPNDSLGLFDEFIGRIGGADPLGRPGRTTPSDAVAATPRVSCLGATT